MKPESCENILQEIAEAKQQIAHLRKKQEDAEITLQLLNERLFQYDKAKTHQTKDLSADSIPAAANISPEDKIALFRQLFRGREDVYPKLWQNQKTAKKGYSPACSNEWVRGACEKPRIKCGDCPCGQKTHPYRDINILTSIAVSQRLCILPQMRLRIG